MSGMRGVASLQIVFLLAIYACATAAPTNGYEPLAADLRWLDLSKSACRSLVIVSTMDGRITALDPKQGGRRLWSMNAGGMPLLQSSLDNIEVVSNGMSYRILPSLDGSLYMMNEVGARGIPINVESLLSSSTKIGSDIFVGSKDVTTYGVDSVTGEVYYTCSSVGCEKHATAYEEEKLIIRRISQIVRGVDVNTGSEKWNISVGEHQVFLTAPQDTIGSCPQELHDDPDYQIKVIPPDGVVFAVSKQTSSQVLWRQKFRSPVAKIWKLNNSVLQELSLFDADIVPSLQNRLLQMKIKENMSTSKPTSGSMIYFGNYGGDHYVIPSPEEKRAMQLYSKGQLRISGHVPVYPMPSKDAGQVYALPGLGAAGGQACKPGSPCSMCSAGEVGELFENVEKNSGWYVFNPTPSSALQKWNQWDYFSAAADTYQKYMTQLMLVDAWEWWKHAVLMCVTLIFVPQIFICMFIFRRRREPVQALQEDDDANKTPVKRKSQESMTETTRNFSNGEADFSSRFLKDFVPIRCLGCGGFGTVFESLNKVDEQKYAVKRIQLQNRDYAKEKVIREVKALAKLDHPGIVRYYNSWFEEPPIDWLKSQDASVFDCREFSDATESDTFDHHRTDRKMKGATSKHRTSLSVALSSLRRPTKEGDDSLEILFANSEPRSTVNIDSCAQCTRSVPKRRLSPVCQSKELQTSNNSTVFLFIQMQLCREYTLMDWLNEHHEQRDHSIMLDWFRQIVEAMMYVHECGIIHRDLKPTNIFFSLTGQMKIGDFGLAKCSLPCEHCSDAEADSVLGEAHHSHTQNVGTYLYMSPEQETNAPYTFKIDIYAIGLIFVELMLPFTTQMERIMTLKSLRKLKLPDLLQHSTAMCDFLLKTLSHEPEERPSCKAILSSAIFTDPL